MSDTQSSAPADKIVRVFHANKIGGSLVHGPIIADGKPVLNPDGTQLVYKLEPGGHADVPESVANIWLSHSHYGGPICTVQPAEDTPVQNRLVEERDALVEENKGLAERLSAMEKLLADLKAAGATAAIPPALQGTGPSPEEIASAKPKRSTKTTPPV